MDRMNNQAMETELMERYLYDVTRRLPEKQKKDIEKELRTLIEDMAEERRERGEEPEGIMEKVLEELGAPAKLAAKYRGEGEHLIGGEYYALYCQILKIVLLCVGAGMALSALVSVIVTATTESMDGFIRSVQGGMIDLGTIPTALVQAFGWVTLVFFFMERNQVKIQKTKEPWKVSGLPQIPYKKAVISRGDSIVGIVFGVVFLVIFICVPEYLGFWIKNGNGEMISVPLFNMHIWNRLLPLLVLSFGLGIVDDLVKLIVGQYNLLVMGVSIVCTISSLAVTCYLFKGTVLFNPNFMQEISSVKGEDFLEKMGKYDIMVHWNTTLANGLKVTDIFLLVLALIMTAELAVTIYRTLRYGVRGRK